MLDCSKLFCGSSSDLQRFDVYPANTTYAVLVISPTPWCYNPKGTSFLRTCVAGCYPLTFVGMPYVHSWQSYGHEWWNSCVSCTYLQLRLSSWQSNCLELSTGKQLIIYNFPMVRLADSTRGYSSQILYHMATPQRSPNKSITTSLDLQRGHSMNPWHQLLECPVP